MSTLSPGARTVIKRVPPGSRMLSCSSRLARPVSTAATAAAQAPAFENVQTHVAPLTLRNEPYVDPLGEVRVALNRWTELEARLSKLVERHCVRIAHRHAAEVKRTSIDRERMIEPWRSGAQRTVSGNQ